LGNYPSAGATCQCSNYGCTVSAQQCLCGYGTAGPSNCGTNTYSTCCLGPAWCHCNNFGAACDSTATQVTSCPPADVCDVGQTPIATCRDDAAGSTDGGPATDDGSDTAIGEASDSSIADSGSDGAIAPPTLSGQIVNGSFVGISGVSVVVGQAVGSGIGNPVMTSTNAMGFWSMPVPGTPGESLSIQMGVPTIENFTVTGSWDFGILI
jgi:hypothetical protein